VTGFLSLIDNPHLVVKLYRLSRKEHRITLDLFFYLDASPLNSFELLSTISALLLKKNKIPNMPIQYDRNNYIAIISDDVPDEIETFIPDIVLKKAKDSVKIDLRKYMDSLRRAVARTVRILSAVKLYGLFPDLWLDTQPAVKIPLAEQDGEEKISLASFSSADFSVYTAKQDDKIFVKLGVMYARRLLLLYGKRPISLYDIIHNFSETFNDYVDFGKTAPLVRDFRRRTYLLDNFKEMRPKDFQIGGMNMSLEEYYGLVYPHLKNYIESDTHVISVIRYSKPAELYETQNTIQYFPSKLLFPSMQRVRYYWWVRKLSRLDSDKAREYYERAIEENRTVEDHLHACNFIKRHLDNTTIKTILSQFNINAENWIPIEKRCGGKYV